MHDAQRDQKVDEVAVAAAECTDTREAKRTIVKNRYSARRRKRQAKIATGSGISKLASHFMVADLIFQCCQKSQVIAVPPAVLLFSAQHTCTQDFCITHIFC